MSELDDKIDALGQQLLQLDVDSEEWTIVAEERRVLLLQRIRENHELKLLLREEFHSLVDS